MFFDVSVYSFCVALFETTLAISHSSVCVILDKGYKACTEEMRVLFYLDKKFYLKTDSARLP